MKNGTKILSALMACMMVTTAFTMFIPVVSADSPYTPKTVKTGDDIRVGEEIYVNGTTNHNYKEIVFLFFGKEFGVGKGVTLESMETNETGHYSFKITVPSHDYGDVWFWVLDSNTNPVDVIGCRIIPDLTIVPAEGAPTSISKKSVTVYGTAYNSTGYLSDSSDFDLDLTLDGITITPDHLEFDSKKNGNVSITFEVPDYKAGSFELKFTQTNKTSGETISATAQFKVIADIVIIPDEATPDMTKDGKAGNVTIRGAGFVENGSIAENSIEFKRQDGKFNVIASHQIIGIAGNGNFTATNVSLPELTVGTYDVYITVLASNGTELPEQKFVGKYTVGPWIVVGPSSVDIGGDVTVTGYGFSENAAINIYLDGRVNPETTVDTDPNGSFVAKFAVNDVARGEHIVTATNADIPGESAWGKFNSTPGISIGNVSGTVGPTTETIGGVTSGSIYSNGHESLGTKVTVRGDGFTKNSVIIVTVSIKNVEYTVAKNVDANATGWFEASFIFPTAPQGTYEITANDSQSGISTANFTVVPGIIIGPQVVVGPSVETIVATGYPLASAGVTVEALLIDGTDALHGTNSQISTWRFDDNGTLISNKLSGGQVVLPGFVLPILETGTYEITLVAGGVSASKSVTVVNNLADLGKIIDDLETNLTGLLEALDAKIVAIDGNVTTIRTILGDVQISLAALDAKIVAVDGKLIDIQTKLGTVQVSLADLDPVIRSIDGNVTIIKTILGDVQVSLADLDAKIVDINALEATIETALGPIKLSLDSLDAKIIDVDGKLVTIDTALGTVQTSLDALDAKIVDINALEATIETALGPIKLSLEALDARIVGVNEDLTVQIETALGTIQGNLRDLDARIDTIDGNVVFIKTELGDVKANLADLDPVIRSIDGNVTTIDTALGTVQTSLDALDAKVVAIDGKLVEIKTAIGTINGEISSIDGDVATIKTDIGALKTSVSTISGQTTNIADGKTEISTDSSTPAWIAAVMAVIAAISAIVCVVILTRKLAG